MSASSAIVFDEIFTVKALDPDGKKFEKGAPARLRFAGMPVRCLLGVARPLVCTVTRLQCEAVTFAQVELVVDVHSELYPLRVGESFSMALATTLSLDGKMGEEEYDQSGEVRSRAHNECECRAAHYADTHVPHSHHCSTSTSTPCTARCSSTSTPRAPKCS